MQEQQPGQLLCAKLPQQEGAWPVGAVDDLFKTLVSAPAGGPSMAMGTCYVPAMVQPQQAGLSTQECSEPALQHTGKLLLELN